MTTPSPQARLTITAAFERFKRSVTADDARRFQDTNLNDVWDTAAEIEDKLANSKSLRNMRRIEPFLRGLEHYASIVEVLCNGTDYLSWIWAPIKLMLQLSSDYLSSLEKLLKAYEMICDNMPRFERLGVAFQKDPNFQQVLALFYADILEFHRRAYKFFRAKAWTRFFHTSWGRFDGRFKAILENIARDSELIDKNANAIDILQAKEFRDKQSEHIAQREKQQEAAELASVITWLQINHIHDQEEELDHLTDRCHQGSCDWILQLEKMEKWMKDDEPQSVIWLHGKPGAGKSVICSSVIKSLQQKDSLILYFFCTYRSLDSSKIVHVLRSLAAQLLRKTPQCAAEVYSNYMGKGLTPSVTNLRTLLPHLLSAAPLTRIVLDGLDECAIEDQKKTLKEILALSQDNSLNCRVMISSREVPGISRTLSQRAKISLSEENKSINMAIESFIKDKLADFEQLQDQNELVQLLGKKINEKAHGMFLWVQLVLNSMEDSYNLQDLHYAIETLPKDLTELYGRILNAIQNRCNERNPRNFEKCVRILQWILHSRRPLTKGELVDAIVLDQENLVIDNLTKLPEEILEICKPLIEEGPNETLVLIHFSLKEYLCEPNCGLPTSARESHYNITLACVAMLLSGLDLLDPEYEENQRLVKTGNGFLTLLPYAHSFWIYHLRQLAQLDSGLSETKAAHVVRCLDEFSSRHNLILRHFPKEAAHQLSDNMLQAINIQGLDRNFSFYDLVSKAVTFCNKLQGEPCNTGPELEQFGLNHDPTLLSQLMYSYEQTVQQLLSADAIPGLSSKSLAAFKRFHGSGSHLCRFYSCPSASRGFATSENRDEHERLMHQRFHCTSSTCAYHKIGFKTSKQLKEHLRSYHSDSEGPRVPDSIIRVQDTSRNETHGHSMTEEGTDQALTQEVSQTGYVQPQNGGLPVNDNFDLVALAQQQADALNTAQAHNTTPTSSNDYLNQMGGFNPMGGGPPGQVNGMARGQNMDSGQNSPFNLRQAQRENAIRQMQAAQAKARGQNAPQASRASQIPGDVPEPIRQRMMELPEEQFRATLGKWIAQKQAGWGGNANVSQPGLQMTPQALQGGQHGGPMGMAQNFLQQNQQPGMLSQAQMQQRLQQELLRRQQHDSLGQKEK